MNRSRQMLTSIAREHLGIATLETRPVEQLTGLLGQTLITKESEEHA